MRGSWEPNSRRCGLLAIKIGVQPLWLKSGKMLVTTMLQIQAGAAAGLIIGRRFLFESCRSCYFFFFYLDTGIIVLCSLHSSVVGP